MRAFFCPTCSQLVFFENSRCLRCDTALGFSWPVREVVAVVPERERCANASLAACNWTVDEPGTLCASCRLTRTRPADDDPALGQFAEAEAAKRRLLFELGELGLWDGGGSGRPPLAFDLLSSERAPVQTGHADGLITLDLAESDDAHRELRRQQLREPYRTVLGHFRHEIGHYYWPVLVPEGPARARFRDLFGDERADYGEALDRHYRDGPPADWRRRSVSAYASMHPWEDWAETFANLLHIRDTVQTAASYGVRVSGPPDRPAEANPIFEDGLADPSGPIRDLLAHWLPLSYALNALSRSMGQEDLFPYVLAPPVIEKLAFIDERVAGFGQG